MEVYIVLAFYGGNFRFILGVYSDFDLASTESERLEKEGYYCPISYHTLDNKGLEN